MKANLYTLILVFFLISVTPGKSQSSVLTVTSYYDFEFSSRINRFHRSYTAFEYYAPVFTDVYWYDPSPYAWGTSIYGGVFSGGAYSYSYPEYGYYNDWYYPEFSGSYYRGYSPVYYNWYSPVVINVNIYNGWHDRYYYNHNGYYSGNVYNVYNNYYSAPRRNYTRSSSTNISRKESSPVNVTDVKDTRRNPVSNEARRNIYRNPNVDQGDNRARNRTANNNVNRNAGVNQGNNNENNPSQNNGTLNGNAVNNGNHYGNSDNRGTRVNPGAPGARRSAERNNVPEKAAGKSLENGSVKSQGRSNGTVRNPGNQSARTSAPEKSSAAESKSSSRKSEESSSTSTRPARRK